jgi:hypothetical protein
MVGNSSNQPPTDPEIQANQEILESQNQTEEESLEQLPINQRSSEKIDNNRDWYDWVDLIARVSIPLTVLVVGFLFSSQQTSNQQIEKDRQMEAALKIYVDDISNLMLEEKLLSSDPGDEVRSIARAKTLNTLRTLDSDRKGLLISFLYDSGLIFGSLEVYFDPNGDKYLDYNDKIDLEGADLRGANLGGYFLRDVNLRRTDLSGTNLSGADLSGAIIREANLMDADLSGADLRWADLSGSSLVQADLGATGFTPTYWDDVLLENLNPGYPYPVDPYPVGLENVVTNLFAANLSETNLTDALVFYEQLEVAYLLTDAIMPDGTKNDGRFVTGNEGTERGFPYPIPYP